jgi:hypothetical protein
LRGVLLDNESRYLDPKYRACSKPMCSPTTEFSTAAVGAFCSTTIKISDVA